MADKVEFELVSPERLLFSEPVQMVVVPGVEGDFGVLPGHAPFVTSVRPGVIAIFNDEKVDQRIFVAGGFAEVSTERCTVLAEEAIAVDEIDQGVLEQRIKDLKEDLEDATDAHAKETLANQLAVAEAKYQAVTVSVY